MKLHAAHPRCSACGKALYKAMKTGSKVTTAMPYAFCRNLACTDFGDQSAERSKKAKKLELLRKLGEEFIDGPVREAKKKGRTFETTIIDDPIKRTEPVVLSRKTPEGVKKTLPRKAIPAAEHVAKPKDNDVVATARVRVAALLKASSAEAGLVLALLNQQVGKLSEANAIIDEFGLEEKFGISKF